MTTHEQNPTTSKQRNEEQRGPQGQGSEMKQKAQHTAEQTAEQAKAQGREIAETAKQEARSMAESRKGQVSSEIDNIVEAFRTTGRELETTNGEPVARYATQIADRLEAASGYLRENSIDDIMSDAEDFARRQPEIFLGSAFGLGFLVSRFFKSSERNMYEGQYRESGYYGHGEYGGRDYYERSGAAYAPRSYTSGATRTQTGQTTRTGGETSMGQRQTGTTGTTGRERGSTTGDDS